MFKGLLMLTLLLPIVSQAKDWVDVTKNEDIKAALSDKLVRFDEHSFQVFLGNGKTRYITERVSEGLWVARDGQYCSAWSPTNKWICYDFFMKEDRVRFVLSDGTFSEGYFDKQ